MHYFVDAYNLLFRLLHKGESVKEAREAMIEDLSKKVNFLDLPTTLVFDSAYQPGLASSAIDKSLEVIYTSEGETADDWLIRYAKNKSSPHQITIVTSDKRLEIHLKIKGIQILSCEAFITFLNKQVRSALKASKPQVPSSEKKKPVTLEKKVAKGSSEYYEKLFQERLGEERPSSEEKRPKKNSLKKEKKLSSESELERWERLFGA